MKPAWNDAEAIIICPLRIEQEILAASGRLDGCRIECCGPGAAAVLRWMDQLPGPSPKPVILAGVAGGLTERCPAGSAFVASRVVQPGSEEAWEPPWPHRVERVAAAGRIITSSDAPIGPAAKRLLHESTHAEVVDMESIAFARRASMNRWKWSIVRGISDDAQTSLPPAIGGWVDPAGRTRLGAAASGAIRRPWLIPALARLRRNTHWGMLAAAALISELLEAGPARD